MKQFHLLIVLFLISITSISQVKPELEEFYSKIKQVKYADANITKTGLDYVVSRGAKENQDVVALKDFLNEQFSIDFILTPEQRTTSYKNSKSYCEVVSVNWKVGSFSSVLGAVGSYPFEISFSFCDGKTYSYSSNINVNGYTFSIANALKRTLVKMFPNSELTYQGAKSIIPEGEVLIAADELKNYLDAKVFNSKHEGLYKLYSSSEQVSIDKIAIIIKDNKLYTLNVENKYFTEDYKYGEVRGMGSKTSVDNIYFGKFKGVAKSDNDVTINFLNESMVEINRTDGSNKMTFIKL